MLKPAAAAAAIALTMLMLCMPAPAGARGYTAARLSDGHVGRARAELVAQLAFSRHAVAGILATPVRWKVALRHRSCWSHVAWSRACDRGRRRLLAHRWLIQVASTRLAALEPRWPAHHQLWLCIHGYGPERNYQPGEARSWSDADTGRNGHWGGLQMHADWGHGTSHHASSDSEVVQERAAEQAYADSGYAASFLLGQWGQTVGPCWSFAA